MRERESSNTRAQLIFPFLMILRLARVALPTSQDHTHSRRILHHGSHTPRLKLNTRRAASMSRGWEPEGLLGSALTADPGGYPNGRPLHSPTQDTWRECSWRRAHWVGHPLWLLSRLALPGVMWSTRWHQILNPRLCRPYWWRGIGSSLTVLSLLMGEGVGRSLGPDFTLTDSLQL